MTAARQAVFPGVPWQRCQFHLQQNAQAYVPRVEMRGSVAADIRSIFTCPDLASAQARLKERAGFYSKSAPKLAAWMEENLPQGFVVHALPEAHRKRMRTSNAIERVNQELQRRPFDPFGFAQGIRGAQGLRHPRRLAVPPTRPRCCAWPPRCSAK